MADTPFAYWPKTDAVLPAGVDLVGSHPGTYVNSPTLNQYPAPPSGESGGWPVFNGTSQYLDVGTLGSLGSLIGGGVAAERYG